jgi:hypothetical protein
MKTETICRDLLPCDHSIAERPRYYARQLITPDDLTLEQDYFRDKLRRHNRLLHGWGVVCGALVCLAPKANSTNESEPWLVKIKRGYLLGPYGDEIILDCDRTVDLRTRGMTGVTGEPCIDVPDPWCTVVFEPRETGDFYVAVKYKEVKTRPVRVQPIGCGCDDTQCEYSRLRDGYEIGILTDCPDSHTGPPEKPVPTDHTIPDCPPCPDEPWVVLAKVTVGANGKIDKIDNCECRRMVFSFGNFWWQCQDESQMPPGGGAPPPAEQRPIDAVRIHRAESREKEMGPGEHEVLIVGENLAVIDSIYFGPDVDVLDLQKEERRLVAKIKVSPRAGGGPRTMEYRDRQGNRGEFKAAIFLRRAEAKAPAAPKKASPGRRGGSRSGEDV